MRIELENIGMLKKASVKVDGLTVIAGENDTGKSTVGKVLFCIIKAISRYKEDFEESKYNKIEETLDRLFFNIRRHTNIEEEEELAYLSDLFSIDYFMHKEDNKETDDYINEIKEYFKKIKDKKEFSIETEELMMLLVEFLNLNILNPESRQNSIKNALRKVFISEFDSNILNYNSESGYIKLYENDLLLLDIVINKNKLELKNKVEPIEIVEATFIETPLILNNHDMLIRSQSGMDVTKRSSRKLNIPYTTLHVKDLFDKLKSRNFEFYFDDEFENNINENIKSIINGEIIYDEEERDFVYIKNKQKIPIKNTATGIKAFGIIKLLIDSGFINRTGLLILDEPEIHIHPKWQLKYAKIISYLVKNGIPIMVNSHSPYMIEALKRYSDMDDLSKNSNFYLAENGLIQNENNLEKIYEKLSEPYDKFDKMDSDILNGK